MEFLPNEDENYVRITRIFSLYEDKSKLGFISLESFKDLIEDLICIKVNKKFIRYEDLVVIVKELGLHGFSHIPAEKSFIEVGDLIRFSNNWEITLKKLRDKNILYSDKIQNFNYDKFFDDRERLYELRKVDTWVYYNTKFSHLNGTNVDESFLKEEGNWKFKNHNDGTGIIYKFERDYKLEDILFYTIQILSKDNQTSFPRPICEENPLDNDAIISPNSPRCNLSVKIEVNRVEVSAYIIGDGNCFYRAIASQLPQCYNDQENHMYIRTCTANCFRKHLDVWRDFGYQNQQELDEYADEMSLDGTWISGDPEFLSAVMAFNLKLHVYEKLLDNKIIFKQTYAKNCIDENTRDVYVVLVNGNHYEVGFRK